MAAPRRRKTASECRRFQTREKINISSKKSTESVCLICNEDVVVMKEHNVRLHYETKHQSYTLYTGGERAQKLEQIAASLFCFMLTKYRKPPQQQAMKSLNLLPSVANGSQRVIS